ncbi:probable exported protein STY0357 [hydrothermal vent metagenome]|uniref:Probable exported protein STY0357 n=1 Tax=hydrothermal vent metagenome TaxID=652676 RepID=A0A1W1EAE5_9ZZZZ
MGKRIWLVIVDILILGLLFVSLILFYLYPLLYTLPKQVSISQRDTKCIQKLPKTDLSVEGNLSLTLTKALDADGNISSKSLRLEEILHISQEVAMQAYLEEAQYRFTPLQTRLEATGTYKGDPLFIRIFKKEALLEVWIKKDERYVHLKDYAICAYSGHLGPKLKEGDKQAPEGFYRVYPKQLNPHSKFHLAFNLGYPNAYDRAHRRTGSYLMVHGNCVSVGCYAMTDAKIEEIYGLVEAALKAGEVCVPVHIFPFRMEDETMDAYSESRWYDFWMELKAGYDYFELEEVPPRVEVEEGHYVILAPE